MGKEVRELRYLEGNYSQGNMGRRLLEMGQDVVQAMELEEEAYSLARLMEEERERREKEQYVVEGTVLTCTACTMEPVTPFEKEFIAPEGSDEIELQVTVGKGKKGELRVATVEDAEKGTNINYFGNCKNLPDRAEEIERVKEAEKSEEKRKLGTCPLLMNLESEWENVLRDESYEAGSNFQCNEIEEITMEAFLFCKHGGFIYPKTLGLPNNQLDDKADYVRDILNTLGWPIDDEELQHLCSVLEDFGILDDSSIACFLLICVTETGPVGIYEDEIDRNGEKYVDQYGRSVTEFLPIGEKRDYEFEERGVGYIQVTWRESQLECLKYLKNNGYWDGIIDENAAGYVNELRTMPWETSAWRWAVSEQTGDGNLNAYVTARATEEERGLTMGIFLAAESFINGKVQDGFSEPLGKIAREEINWQYNPQNGMIEITDLDTEGKIKVIESYSAPKNWNKFEENYEKLARKGIV